MMRRAVVFFFTGLLLLAMVKSACSIPDFDPENDPGSAAPKQGDIPATPDVTSPPPTVAPPVLESTVPSPAVVEAPNDPCLPGLYTNWQEFSQDNSDGGPRPEFKALRIYIDRLNFQLVLEGLLKDDSVEEIYRTHVALGDVGSPTPEGRYVVNHIYCYPDVVFFDANAERVPGLYNGFFAPLLICDEQGKCQRFRELGMHGFQASAIPAGRHISPATVGAVSAGCIRLPDPCKFKKALMKAAGLGGLKYNDRGAYHWLKRPVEVVINDGYPDADDTNLASIIERGVTQVQEGLKSLFDVFR